MAKTGADAVYQVLRLALGTITRYRVKLLAFCDEQWAAGHITADQNTTAHAFIDSCAEIKAVFEVLAQYNNVR